MMQREAPLHVQPPSLSKALPISSLAIGKEWSCMAQPALVRFRARTLEAAQQAEGQVVAERVEEARVGAAQAAEAWRSTHWSLIRMY